MARMTQTPGHRVAAAPSMQDVADRAGVAIGTVSNVLNRPDRVRSSTRQKVEAAIAELGFVRNSAARNLAAGSSNLIGLVIADIGNSFFVDIARGVETASAAVGLQLLLANSDVDLRRQDQFLNLFDEARAAGLILAPLDGPLSAARTVSSHGRPMVLVNAPSVVDDLCNVRIDDHLGGQLATRHLIEQGCQRLAYVGGPFSLNAVRNRRDGAGEAARDVGVPLGVIETAGLKASHGREAAQALLAKGQQVDGIICASDWLAAGVVSTAVSLGIEVPRDLAVIGYDDNHFAADSLIPLSTIGQSGYRMGQLATELLLEEMAAQAHRHRSLRIEPNLIVRRSSQRNAR